MQREGLELWRGAYDLCLRERASGKGAIISRTNFPFQGTGDARNRRTDEQERTGKDD